MDSYDKYAKIRFSPVNLECKSNVKIMFTVIFFGEHGSLVIAW